jgi:hypothetical protein
MKYVYTRLPKRNIPVSFTLKVFVILYRPIYNYTSFKIFRNFLSTQMQHKYANKRNNSYSPGVYICLYCSLYCTSFVHRRGIISCRRAKQRQQTPPRDIASDLYSGAARLIMNEDNCPGWGFCGFPHFLQEMCVDILKLGNEQLFLIIFSPVIAVL